MVQDNDNKSVRNMMNETLINENNLRLANEKAMYLTIRKLTYINPYYTTNVCRRTRTRKERGEGYRVRYL